MPLSGSVSSIQARSVARSAFENRTTEIHHNPRPSQKMNSPGPQTSDSLVRRRVLLVEDETLQRRALSTALEHGGFEVVTANDGQQALDVLNQQDISLVITDWEMPNLDGPSLCRAIRSAKNARYTYIIMLAGREEVQSVVRGLQSGADDYLAKPCVEPELLARLNTGMRLLELESSLRRSYEENQRLCVIDALTGTYNRRYLEEQLALELARAVRYKHALSILLCDIDHFKTVNDNYGHQCGDNVLIKCAEELNKCLRKADWMARYGGEEFIIVLPETDPASAMVVAERCRVALENTSFRGGGKSFPLTASFGVTGVGDQNSDSANLTTLIAEADAALYTSKKNGRNRITLQRAGII
jgi:diguanylate cyclase (GGDEF)-like protein